MKDTINDKNLKEIINEKFEMLSLKLEKLTSEMEKVTNRIEESNKIDIAFGLKTLRNSNPLDFAQDIFGIGSATKNYLLSIRAITQEWKGRKNDFLITIRQQDKENHLDLKALAIRIPLNDIKTLSILAREIISLLYIASEHKGIEITQILKEILDEINKKGPKMINEINSKMA